MIYAKKKENPQGDYIDTATTRWDFTAAVTIRHHGTKTPEQLGYTTFESVEDALTTWHLTYDPIPIPEPELPYPDNNQQ